MMIGAELAGNGHYSATTMMAALSAVTIAGIFPDAGCQWPEYSIRRRLSWTPFRVPLSGPAGTPLSRTWPAAHLSPPNFTILPLPLFLFSTPA